MRPGQNLVTRITGGSGHMDDAARLLKEQARRVRLFGVEGPSGKTCGGCACYEPTWLTKGLCGAEVVGSAEPACDGYLGLANDIKAERGGANDGQRHEAEG